MIVSHLRVGNLLENICTASRTTTRLETMLRFAICLNLT